MQGIAYRKIFDELREPSEIWYADKPPQFIVDLANKRQENTNSISSLHFAKDSQAAFSSP
jgi:hypothetical protein